MRKKDPGRSKHGKHAAKAERLRNLALHTEQALRGVRSKGSLLENLAWPREVEEEFFAHRGERLPKPKYAVPRHALARELTELEHARRGIPGAAPVPTFLRNVLGSMADRNRLLLAVGTKSFGDVSKSIYGGAKTPFYDTGLTNLDLAEHLLRRLAVHGYDAPRKGDLVELDAKGFAAFLEERIAKRKLPIRVRIDGACSSKAIAGAHQVRIRPDATFTEWEAEGLYRHEVETHAFSALNASLQPFPALLRSGGPRSTPTQEGLAVFSELYHRALAVPRLRRLALRVRMVSMAEDGASFLDVYRFLVNEEGLTPKGAYLDTARIFRGGPPEGGGPFTKDAVYVAGLLHVYSFLQAFVREGFRDETEMLVAGRFALDDMAALIELRALGLLVGPRHRPRWLREWTTLLPYFAFTSFLDGIDLAPVARAHDAAIRVANARRGP